MNQPVSQDGSNNVSAFCVGLCDVLAIADAAAWSPRMSDKRTDAAKAQSKARPMSCSRVDVCMNSPPMCDSNARCARMFRRNGASAKNF